MYVIHFFRDLYIVESPVALHTFMTASGAAYRVKSPAFVELVNTFHSSRSIDQEFGEKDIMTTVPAATDFNQGGKNLHITTYNTTCHRYRFISSQTYILARFMRVCIP